MLWFFITSSAMALMAILVFLYYLQKGQFDDQEDVKYQMFHDDEK